MPAADFRAWRFNGGVIHKSLSAVAIAIGLELPW
jgi:hypothetical protein